MVRFSEEEYLEIEKRVTIGSGRNKSDFVRKVVIIELDKSREKTNG
ncbi:MAG: hypothetical protein LBG63_00945 [Candidatus Methanoplasma sp.]|nr:hypothetical protein [Candidatus Methanoplasma sp.]